MFLRATKRIKDGKEHLCWSMVESMRVGRRVFQRLVTPPAEPQGDGLAREHRGRGACLHVVHGALPVAGTAGHRPRNENPRRYAGFRFERGKSG